MLKGGFTVKKEYETLEMEIKVYAIADVMAESDIEDGGFAEDDEVLS